jgi:hypothetical protein
MDSRDVNIDQYLSHPDWGLRLMWDKQKELVDHYTKIESLPQYPINLDTKDSQNLMKDFVSRVVEELAESYEARLQGFEEGSLEEVADAFHFILEVMVFTEPNLDKWLSLEGVIPGGPNQPLKYLVDGAPNYLYDILRGPIEPHPIINWFWGVTYFLNIARNNLRNKPWKQTQILAQKADFQRNVWKAFVVLVKGVQFYGMTYNDIVEQYLKKNEVNQFRIKSKY